MDKQARKDEARYHLDRCSGGQWEAADIAAGIHDRQYLIECLQEAGGGPDLILEIKKGGDIRHLAGAVAKQFD